VRDLVQRAFFRARLKIPLLYSDGLRQSGNGLFERDSFELPN